MGVDFKSSNVIITGNLSVSNNMTILGDVSFSNNFTFAGNVTMGASSIITTGDGLFKVNGNLQCSGDLYGFSTLSDERLKTNVKNLQNCLDVVNSLRPVEYIWKDDIFNESKRGSYDTGLIAQEVSNVIPVVNGHYYEYMTVKYEKIVPYLIGAIQELSLGLGPRDGA